jgi:sporulation protein YtfJ
MDNAFTKIKTLVETDVIVGTPVTTADGVSIVPVSKITMGFLTGGGEYSDMSRQTYAEYPFAGGSGAGVSVSPIAFLVSDGKSVKLVSVDEKSAFDKILNLIPETIASIIDGGTIKK